MGKRKGNAGLFDQEAISEKLSTLGNPLERLHNVIVLGELIISYNSDVGIKNAIIKELELDALSPNSIIPQGLYLSMVSVLPKFQGQKIGQKLIKSVEISANSLGYDRVSIKVEMDNPRAEELYKRLGYKFIDEHVANGVVLRYLEKRVAV